MRTHFKPEIKKSKVSIQKHEAHREQQFKQTKPEKTSRNVLIWNLLLLLSMKITTSLKRNKKVKTNEHKIIKKWEYEKNLVIDKQWT